MLVQDNLNTHTPASLYEAFEPAEARRLAVRFEWHDTPPFHKVGTAAGSIWLSPNWLYSPASASIVAFPMPQTLTTEVAAWQAYRNAHNAKANWHFTAADARVKLKSLYPAI